LKDVTQCHVFLHFQMSEGPPERVSVTVSFAKYCVSLSLAECQFHDYTDVLHISLLSSFQLPPEYLNHKGMSDSHILFDNQYYIPSVLTMICDNMGNRKSLNEVYIDGLEISLLLCCQPPLAKFFNHTGNGHKELDTGMLDSTPHRYSTHILCDNYYHSVCVYLCRNRTDQSLKFTFQ
jgi:hypothetical protein